MSDVIKFTIFADDKASGKFSKFNSTVKSGFGIMKTFGKAALGAGATVVGFTTIVAKHNDLQGKFASRINQSVSELTAYQHAADLAGINTNTFNMATQRMTRRVAEAANNTGEAQDALRELGIDAKAFQNIGLENQMTSLADVMGDVTNENDKLRLAFKLFDSEGTAMLQMLNEGSDAMKEAANDAQFLGLVIDDRAAAAADLFNSKMTRATGAIRGMSNGIAAELMPIITGLADRFADFVASNRTNIAEFVKNSVVGFFTIGEIVSQVFDRIGEILTDPKALTDFVKSVHAMAVQVGVLALDISQVIARGILEGLTVAKDLVVGFGTWIGESLAKIVMGQETETIGESLAKIFTDSFANAKDVISSTITDIGTVVADSAPDIGERLNEAFAIDMDTARSNAEETIAGLSLFADSTAEQIKNTEETLTTFMAAVQEQKAAFRTWLEESDAQFVESFANSAQTAVDSISSGMGEAMVAGTSLLKVFQNVAKQVAAQIIASFIKLGIQRLILSKVMGGAITSESSAGAAKAVGLAGANMFASMAAAPFPLNLTAPAASAAAMAGASAAFTTGAAAGAGLGASVGLVAHGGLTNNPSEQTATIHKGERIISPRQNKDLTDALDSGTLGGGITVENLNITMFPNATNADAVFQMDADEVADVLGTKVVDALDILSDRGIRPRYLEEL